MNWNLPFLFCHDRFGLDLYRDYYKTYQKPLFNSVFGGFANVWNGGRLPMEITDDYTHYKTVIKTWNEYNVRCWLTCSKSRLTKDEVYNQKMIDFLSSIQQLNIGLIIANRELFSFLKSNFPAIPLKASINTFYARNLFARPHYTKPDPLSKKFKREKDELEMIRRLIDKGYKYVVPRCEFIHNLEGVEKGYRKHIEILLNNHCMWECPRRVEHIKFIEDNNCEYAPTKNFDCIRMYESCEEANMSWEDWIATDCSSEFGFSPQYLVDKGFTNFKLEGRNLPPIEILTDMEKYMSIEKEFIAKWRLLATQYL